MVQRLRPVVAAAHRRTVRATHGTSVRLPLLGVMLAAWGAILLIAGWTEVRSLGPSTLRAWTQPRVVAWSNPGDVPRNTRSLVSEPCCILRTEGTGSTQHDDLHSAATTPHRLRRTSKDPVATALLPSPLSHVSQSVVWDEVVPGRTVPVERSDPRAALLELSVGQHTGRWTSACPCTGSSEDASNDPTQANIDDWLAKALFDARQIPPPGAPRW
jgi:hypothetical protein